MEHRIALCKEKKLVGKRLRISFSENSTFELWKSFMPGRKEIQNNVGTELYSLQNYPPFFFDKFNPNAEFEKWACLEVKDFKSVPPDMETYILPAGLYAVFVYQGLSSMAADTFQYILGTWLPQSGYSLDQRPHFEILGEKYKYEDPASEEEIWIPIRSGKEAAL